MDSIISPRQSPFKKKQCIQDNILLCHDMLQKFHLPQGKGRMCVKIYLRKAFDSVDGGFLEAAMLAMCFPQKWLEWIRACKPILNISIVINYPPRRFPQQYRSQASMLKCSCIPLSPYFFAIIMECLSLILKICEEAKLVLFPYSKDGVSVSHLLFADDLMRFPNPDIQSVQKRTLAFQDFHTYSGLPVNFHFTQPLDSSISQRKIGMLSPSVVSFFLKDRTVPGPYQEFPPLFLSLRGGGVSTPTF